MKSSAPELAAAEIAARLQALSARADAIGAGLPGPTPLAGAAPKPDAPGSFADLMGRSIETVNRTVQEAEARSAAFLREDPGASLAETMIAVNKAKVSFQMMVEVRNRLVQAYQDIAQMPI